MCEREALRKKYNLKEEPMGDCPTALCCGPCAICQEAREIKFRGRIFFIEKFCF
jgi:Cys-rich protein (TIGR01571 family)